MKKLFAVFALIPALAFGGTTWTAPAGPYTASKAACTTGTEVAPSGAVGLGLAGLKGVAVFLECGGAPAAGLLLAYSYNPVTGNWVRVKALDLSVEATTTTQTWDGLEVLAGAGRLAYVPSGLGAVACDVYLVGSR